MNVQIRYPFHFGSLVHAQALPAVVLAILILPRAFKGQPSQVLPALRGAALRAAAAISAAAVPAALGAARVLLTGAHLSLI